MFIHRLDVDDSTRADLGALPIDRRLERPSLHKHHLLVRVVMRRVRHLSRHQSRNVQIHWIAVVRLSMKNLARLVVVLRIRLHWKLIEDITLRRQSLALPLSLCGE